MKRLLVWTWTLLGLLQVGNAADQTLCAEARECFEWFATLGYPDVKDSPGAEVWTGQWSMIKDSPETKFGFIINTRGNRFTVLCEDLTSATLTPVRSPERRIGYEKKSLHEYALSMLKLLHNPPNDAFAADKAGLERINPKLGLKTKIFFLAYACMRRGDTSLAQQLFEEMERIPVSNSIQVQPRVGSGTKLDLERELAEQALWQGILLFGGGNLGWNNRGIHGGPLVSRVELLNHFHKMARLYPHSTHLEEASKITTMLERMTREDKEHPVISDAVFNKLPEDRQIAELVFRLRDQNGHLWAQPGECDIFDEIDKTSDHHSPAHRLAEIGYAAVPQLLDALGDDRLSRSVTFWRDFTFSHRVLRVGDCALQVLERISGRDFQEPNRYTPMKREERLAKITEAADAWWDDLQTKGEKKWLVDEIASGAHSPDALMERMKAKYPEAVEDALIAGATNAVDEWIVRRYIWQVGQLSSPAVTDFLLRQMQKGRTLAIRLDAARNLLERHHPAVLPAMLEEWRTAPAEIPPLTHDDFATLVKFLARSGKAEALNALTEEANQWSVRRKVDLLEVLSESIGLTKCSINSGIPHVALEPAARDKVEEFLIRELEDPSIYQKERWMDFKFDEPRLCDFALWALHRLSPKRYSFTNEDTKEQRDQKRLAASNLWRKGHHLQPWEIPDRRLPALASENSLKITSVLLFPLEAGKPVVSFPELAALKGQIFTGDTVVKIMRAYARDKALPSAGLDVEAARDADLTGVHLTISVDPGPVNADRDWNVDVSITSAKDSLLSFRTGMSREQSQQENQWKSILEAASKAITTSPTTPFTVTLTFWEHERW